jgi:hypothetical protein
MIPFSFDGVQKSLISVAVVLLVVGIGIPDFNHPQPDIRLTSSVIPNSTPSLCIGFDPKDKTWGYERSMCPTNYAAYAVDDPGGPERSGPTLDAQLVCCPLPSSDILSEEHVMVEESCPSGYIATGSTGYGCGRECVKKLRCTKINSERYQLGEVTASVYWGNGHAGWKGSKRIEWEEIPPGMRYSVGRISADKWNIDGCVGYPWGSLLTKKSSKYCRGWYFRQLQFAGKAGDPEKGTPVRMYPACFEVVDHDKPGKARCIES